MTILLQVTISNRCLVNAALDEDLLRDWLILVDNPVRDEDFKSYFNFVQTWGTHLINGLTTGSRLKFFSTSKATNTMSEDMYQAKLCAGYSGISAKANACAGITDGQKSEVSKDNGSECSPAFC